MSDEVSRDDDNSKQEPKKTGFWKRMFVGTDEQDSTPESQDGERTQGAETVPEPAPAPPVVSNPEPEAAPATTTVNADSNDDGEGFWARMKQGMSKTRKGLGKGLADLLVGAKEIDDEIPF